MIVQSCVKDITVNNLNEGVYSAIASSFDITITVDDKTPQDTDSVTLTDGSATMNSGTSNAICFSFDETTVISRYPARGRQIKFDIGGNGATYGSVIAYFPNPSSGSVSSSFRTDTDRSIPGFEGTITYSLYHSISLDYNIYISITCKQKHI